MERHIEVVLYDENGKEGFRFSLFIPHEDVEPPVPTNKHGFFDVQSTTKPFKACGVFWKITKRD